MHLSTDTDTTRGVYSALRVTHHSSIFAAKDHLRRSLVVLYSKSRLWGLWFFCPIKMQEHLLSPSLTEQKRPQHCGPNKHDSL